MIAKEAIQHTEEEKLAILKYYGKTKDSIEEDVKIIQKWLTTQPHIPEITDSGYILKFLLLNKCSIERTKEKIDNYYSIRNFAPELFCRHPLSPEMLKGYKLWHWVHLPQLVNLHRVSIFKILNDDPDQFNHAIFYNHVINVAEFRLRYDYCLSDISILDLSNVRIMHLFKSQPSLLHKFQIVTEKVYSNRVKEIHVINGFEAILSVLRSALKPKLRDRIFVHKNYNSLYEHIPREVLPKDLGGEGKTLKELAEMQLKCFEEMKDRFDALVAMRSNEALRPGKPVNDEFYGFYGNFKNIEVD